MTITVAPRDLDTLTEIYFGLLERDHPRYTDAITDHKYDRYARVRDYLLDVLLLNPYEHTEEERRRIGEKGIRIMRRTLASVVPRALLEDDYAATLGAAYLRRVGDTDECDGPEALIDAITRECAGLSATRETVEELFAQALVACAQRLELSDAIKKKS
jgi:hypothetical protein